MKIKNQLVEKLRKFLLDNNVTYYNDKNTFLEEDLYKLIKHELDNEYSQGYSNGYEEGFAEGQNE